MDDVCKPNKRKAHPLSLESEPAEKKQRQDIELDDVCEPMDMKFEEEIDNSETVAKKKGSRICKNATCDKRAIFGVKGTNIGIYCVNHKEPTHVDVKHKKCQSIGCEKGQFLV